MASISHFTVPTSSVITPARSPCNTRITTKVRYINGLNSYGGLKAHNKVTSLGLQLSTEHCFSNIVGSLKGVKSGGALTSTCNAIAEIFKIAAIMPGLVLVGVAVGFVLLRIEASLEEE